MSKSCVVKCCENKRVSRTGFCQYHNARVLKNIPLDLPKHPKKKTKTCQVRGCKSEAVVKDMCRLHYGRKRDGVSMQSKKQMPAKGKSCIICGQPVLSKMLCSRHYHQDLSKRKAKQNGNA